MRPAIGVQVERSRYLTRETLISAAVNALISIGFFLLVFGGLDPVPVWGMGNYAFDFVPQSFAIGLMATLVPGLLCRKAIAEGRVSGSALAPPTVLARAFLNGALAVLVGAGGCALLLWAIGAGTLAHNPAFGLKVLYGAALGALITRLALRRMLA